MLWSAPAERGGSVLTSARSLDSSLTHLQSTGGGDNPRSPPRAPTSRCKRVCSPPTAADAFLGWVPISTVLLVLVLSRAHSPLSSSSRAQEGCCCCLAMAGGAGAGVLVQDGVGVPVSAVHLCKVSSCSCSVLPLSSPASPAGYTFPGDWWFSPGWRMVSRTV